VGVRPRDGAAPRAADPISAARHELLDTVIRALDGKGCAQRKALWIAEIGTFDQKAHTMEALGSAKD